MDAFQTQTETQTHGRVTIRKAAWAFTRLALYLLQRGNPKQALDSCAAALALQSDYAPAMLARGRALLAINRSAEALVEFQRAAKLNPLPECRWALADALTITGNRDQAAEVESQITAQTTDDPRTRWATTRRSSLRLLWLIRSHSLSRHLASLIFHRR